MSVNITRTEMKAGELRKAASRCTDARASRRMLAIALVLEGSDRGTAVERQPSWPAPTTKLAGTGSCGCTVLVGAQFLAEIVG